MLQVFLSSEQTDVLKFKEILFFSTYVIKIATIDKFVENIFIDQGLDTETKAAKKIADLFVVCIAASKGHFQ